MLGIVRTSHGEEVVGEGDLPGAEDVHQDVEHEDGHRVVEHVDCGSRHSGRGDMGVEWMIVMNVGWIRAGLLVFEKNTRVLCIQHLFR